MRFSLGDEYRSLAAAMPSALTPKPFASSKQTRRKMNKHLSKFFFKANNNTVDINLQHPSSHIIPLGPLVLTGFLLNFNIYPWEDRGWPRTIACQELTNQQEDG